MTTDATDTRARDLARDITRIVGQQTDCLLLSRLQKEALVKRFDTGAYEWHRNGAVPPTKAEWTRMVAGRKAGADHAAH
jgi:hypothetical protein